VVEVHIPPLRQRQEDIPLLAEFFSAAIAAREGRSAPVISPEVEQMLTKYPWPGNVRELANFMERAMIFCRGGVLDPEALPGEMRRQSRISPEDFPLKELPVA
jgi:two-component system, NtrC family, response regulator AtoC